MKLLTRSLIGLLALCLVGAIVLATNFIFKPWNINLFFHRAVAEFALERPELLSSLRVLDSLGIKFHNDDLDPSGPEYMDRVIDRVEEYKTLLSSYEDGELSKSELLSKKVMKYLFDFFDAWKPFRFHNYPVNQLFGIQNAFPEFMQSKHVIESAGDARDYITRLGKIDQKFAGVIRSLDERTRRGILPPRFVVDRVLDEMKGFIGTPVESNILYSSFLEKLEASDIEEHIKKELALEVKNQIHSKVYPSYQSLINYFVKIKPITDDRVGIWKQPRGDEFYQVMLNFYTTTDLSADEVHAVGLSEVMRIQEEILTILKQEDVSHSEDFFTGISALANQERFYYSDDEEGRAKILEDYQKILNEIDLEMPKTFRLRPEVGMKVERIPLYKEKTAPGAYYHPPSLDNKRPGIFYANLFDIKATPKYSMRTLAYHEGIPGHHFQIAIAQRLDHLPIFRRFVPFTAYSEGWALYAERLAWEMGLQNNPFDNIGRLQAELFRAVRLVVDTGIHRNRWSRQQAIDYMQQNTGMALSDVTAEIERYIVMPGQACSYKIGMMKILEYRDWARQELGKDFDLRDFHDVILKGGALPMPILRSQIDSYVRSIKQKTVVSH